MQLCLCSISSKRWKPVEFDWIQCNYTWSGRLPLGPVEFDRFHHKFIRSNRIWHRFQSNSNGAGTSRIQIEFDWICLSSTGSSACVLDPVEFEWVQCTSIGCLTFVLDPVEFGWIQSNSIVCVQSKPVEFDWIQCKCAGSSRTRLDLVQFHWTMCRSIDSNVIMLDPIEFVWTEFNLIGSSAILLYPIEFHCNCAGSGRLDPLELDWIQSNSSAMVLDPFEDDWTQCNSTGSSAIVLDQSNSIGPSAI